MVFIQADVRAEKIETPTGSAVSLTSSFFVLSLLLPLSVLARKKRLVAPKDFLGAVAFFSRRLRYQTASPSS